MRISTCLNYSQLISWPRRATGPSKSPMVSWGCESSASKARGSPTDSNRTKFFGKWQIKHIIRNQRYWVDSYKLGIQSTNPTCCQGKNFGRYWRTKEDSGLGGNRHGSCIRYHWYHLHFSETQSKRISSNTHPLKKQTEGTKTLHLNVILSLETC